MKAKIVAFFCICFISINISAQIWTLDSCIAYAIENNTILKQKRLLLASAHAQTLQSKASFLPAVNAGMDYNMNYGRSLNRFTNDFSSSKTITSNLYLGVSFSVFSGMQKVNNSYKATYNYFAEAQDYSDVVNTISLSVATSFLQVLYAKEFLAIAQNQLLLTNQQYDKIKKQIEVGASTKKNLLDIEAQLANEEMQIISAQNQLQLSYLSLAQMMDIVVKDSLNLVVPAIAEPSDSIVFETVDEIYKKAMVLPQIVRAEMKIKVAEKNFNMTKSSVMPKLGFNFYYYSGYSDARKLYTENGFRAAQIGTTQSGNSVLRQFPLYSEENYNYKNQLKDNANFQFSFRLTIPIFNNLANQTQIKNAKIGLLNSQYSSELEKQNLYKDIQKARADALSAASKYNGQKKALKSIEENFTYVDNKFGLGLLTSIDFNNAKTQLTKAKSDLLQSKYDYVFKKTVLDFYSGKPIKFY